MQHAERLLVEGLDIELTRKRVRNINLRVRQDGTVAVSAPTREPLERIETFVRSRRKWIEQAQQRVLTQQLENACICRDGATLRLWGKPLACRVTPSSASDGRRIHIGQEGDELLVYATPELAGEDDDALAARNRALEAWLREQLSARMAALLPTCERVVGKSCSGIRLRNMSSRWGSCNVQTGRITISTRLVHHDPSCLEYVLYHELCHLHEPSHNKRFHALMDRFYPRWRQARAHLNG